MEVDRLKRKYKQQKEKLCYLQLTCRAQEDRIEQLELALQQLERKMDCVQSMVERVDQTHQAV
jgi:hypothetical protein